MAQHYPALHNIKFPTKFSHNLSLRHLASHNNISITPQYKHQTGEYSKPQVHAIKQYLTRKFMYCTL